jgi:hypothetical protein
MDRGVLLTAYTGTQACLAPWVTRPLPAKKSTKVGREVFRSSFEQFACLVSIFEAGANLALLECYSERTGPIHAGTDPKDYFAALSKASSARFNNARLGRLTPLSCLAIAVAERRRSSLLFFSEDSPY